MSTASEIKRKIRRRTNCYFVREGANHEVWMNPDTGKIFTIPRHPSQEVNYKTEQSIYKQAGLK